MRKAEGYRQLAAAMGEMVRERVWLATGSWTGNVLGKVCTGGVRGDAVGDEYTIGIGDESIIGGGTTIEYGITLVGGTNLGGGNNVGMKNGGKTAVLVFKWAKRSQSLEISDSFSWWTVVEASLVAQDKFLIAWTILSSEVTSGWVR